MNPIEAYLVIKAFAKISNVTPNTALKYCAKYAPLYLSSLGTTEEETVEKLSQQMVLNAFENNIFNK